MNAPLKVCFAASEAVPFAKTGGLADVAAALPRQLFLRGLDIRLFIPFYGSVDRREHAVEPVESAADIAIALDRETYRVSLWRTRLPASDLPVYLVDCPGLYHRERLYTSDDDEAERFLVFSRAVLESCQRLGWGADIFHCNDWHTGLLPLLLKSLYAWDTLFQRSRTILTVHNLGYQGIFDAVAVERLGLADCSEMLDAEDLDEDRLNFLRTGLIHADQITTVSPTYAQEIQTEAHGMGLDELLRRRKADLVGILNGVDYEEWSPERDRWIPHRYSRSRPEGKRKNKRYLMNLLGLGDQLDAPLIGIVSRLAGQKGFELCFPVLPKLLRDTDLRIAVLGEGESEYEKFFRDLARRFPGRAAFRQGHDEELAHLIEAGSDMFLMPSRYEPCGLNQMFSLRYGTIPVVRKTGGLADSVEPADPAQGDGTGFLFEPFEAKALRGALLEALSVYREPDVWRRLVANAMGRNFSWTVQAGRYHDLYRDLAAR